MPAPASSRAHVLTPINTTEAISQVPADACNRQNPATIVSEEALKAIFSEDEGLFSLAVKLIHLLNTVQKKVNLIHRLHLFVESDRGFAKGVPEGHAEVMHRVQTRVAFSPTLCSSDPQQQSGLSRIYGELTNLSFQNAPTGSSYRLVFNSSAGKNASRDHGNTVLPQALPLLSDTPRKVPNFLNHTGDLRWPESITKEFHNNFQSWCPFAPESGESGYTTAPQNSKNHQLLLEKDIMDRFRYLKEFQVMWVYQELFLFMHRQGRTFEKYGRVSGMAKSITYSQFTPPWIRLKLVVKAETTATNDTEIEAVSEIVILNRAGVTDLRKERNIQGYRRLRSILAAFYSQEKESVRPLIDYLLTVVPKFPPKLRRKPKKRKQRETEESVNNDSTNNNSTAEPSKKRTKLAASSNTDIVEPEKGDTRLPSNRVNHGDAVRPTETSHSTIEPAMSANLNPSSHFPVTDKSTSNVTEKPRKKLTERASATAIEKPTSTVTEKWCSKISQANPPVQHHQRRESVFGDRAKVNSEAEPITEEADDILTTTGTQPNSEKCLENSEQGIHNNPAQSEQSAPDEILTPFSEDLDLNIHEDSGNSNDELEKNPFSGIFKCGALAQCHWVLNLDMQDPQKMVKKCISRQVPMHTRCFAFRRSIRNFCTKKAIFDKIYEEERETNT